VNLEAVDGDITEQAVAAVRQTADAGPAAGVVLTRFVLFGPGAHAAFREALAAS
jgi:hypothetical protein